MNATAPPMPPPEATESRVTLYDVPWSTYLVLLGEEEHDGRFFYDDGILEIMTVGYMHENLKELIGDILTFYLFNRRIAYRPFGNATWRREAKRAGLEADLTYLIQRAHQIAGRVELNLPDDPAPDLAVEIDISRSSVAKFRVYRDLGIPEIWRVDGQRLVVHRADAAGEYPETTTSAALPGFPLDAAQTAIDHLFQTWDHPAALDLFRAGAGLA